MGRGKQEARRREGGEGTGQRGLQGEGDSSEMAENEGPSGDEGDPGDECEDSIGEQRPQGGPEDGCNEPANGPNPSRGIYERRSSAKAAERAIVAASVLSPDFEGVWRAGPDFGAGLDLRAGESGFDFFVVLALACAVSCGACEWPDEVFGLRCGLGDDDGGGEVSEAGPVRRRRGADPAGTDTAVILALLTGICAVQTGP